MTDFTFLTKPFIGSISEYDKKAKEESSDLFQLTETKTYTDKVERELAHTIFTHCLPFEGEKCVPKQGVKFAEEVDVQFLVASGMLVVKHALKGQEEVSNTEIDDEEETH